MQIFQTNDSTSFIFNNERYVKNFIVMPVGNTHIQVLNAYDSKLQLLANTHYSEVSIDGTVYGSQSALVNALSTVCFSKGTGSGSFNQNNTGLYFTYPSMFTTVGNTITAAELANKINATITFGVSEINSPVLFQLQRPAQQSGSSSIILKKYIFLFTGGKGSWGEDGIAVSSAQFKLIFEGSLVPDDIEDDDNSVINYLGDIADGDYISVANETEWDFFDTDKTYYFSYVTDGVLYYVVFVGEAGLYGGDNQLFIEDDFIDSTNSDALPYIPTLQEVITQGSTATTVNNISINTTGASKLLYNGSEVLNTARIGVANGIVPTDGANKIPVSYLPNTVMIYKGMWNLSTNTPALLNGTGTTGWVYKVTGAATPINFNFGAGNIQLTNGDYVIYSDTGVWEKSDGSDAVTSVNGYQGVVNLSYTDVGAAASAHTHTIAQVTSLQSSLDLKAPLASPALTGIPTAPTAGAGTSNTQVATTAFATQIATSAATATVSQTITDGVTTSSPSQNAVYDALALKANLAGGNAFTGVQTIDSNVSIGATSQFARLNIADGPGGSQIAMVRGTGGYTLAMATNDNSLIFYAGVGSATTGTTRFFSDGNVIISNNISTNNGYKLDVNGTGRFTGQLTIPDGTATTSAINLGQLNTNLALKANTNGSNASGTWSNITAGNSNGLGGYQYIDNNTISTVTSYLIRDGINIKPALPNTVAENIRANAAGTWPISITGNSVTSNTSIQTNNWLRTITTDFNNETGYKLLEAAANTTTNQPIGNQWGTGIQFSTNSNTGFLQQVIFNVTGRMFTRNKNNNTWGGWNEIPYDTEVVHIAGSETIGGTKTFSNPFLFSGTNFDSTVGEYFSIKNKLASGNWARGFNVANTSGSTYAEFGVYGTGQAFNYGYLGLNGSGTPSSGAMIKYTSTGVGINLPTTITPAYKLDVNGDANIKTQLNIADGNWCLRYNTGTTAFNIYRSSGYEFVIKNGGNVGLGVESPETNLDVAGDVQLKGIMRIRKTGINDVWDTKVDASGNYTLTDIFQTVTPYFAVTPSGNIGIGTIAPNGKLHIADGAGGSQLALSRGTGGVLFGQALNEDGLILYKGITGSTVYQRWHNSGNITVGTATDAGYKFSVQGTGMFTGEVTIPNGTASSSAVNKGQLDTKANINGTNATGSWPISITGSSSYSSDSAKLGGFTYNNTESINIDNFIVNYGGEMHPMSVQNAMIKLGVDAVRANLTVSMPATSANSYSSVSGVSVPGAQVGDFVQIVTTLGYNGGIIYHGFVTAANTVSIHRFNGSSSGLSASDISMKIKLTR